MQRNEFDQLRHYGHRGGRRLFQPSHVPRRGIRLAPLLLIAVMLAAVAVLAETSNPAQTAYAHGGDDHTHRCTSPPDDHCPGYGDVASGVPAHHPGRPP